MTPMPNNATGLQCCHVACESVPVQVDVARFRGADGVEELHIAAHPVEDASFEDQLSWLRRGAHEVLDALGIEPGSAILRRFFCRDIARHAHALVQCDFSTPGARGEQCAVSRVGQPPLPPAKVALWAYHIVDPANRVQKQRTDDSLTVRRGELAHHWTCGVQNASHNAAHDQTSVCFATYDAHLKQRGLAFADNVMRTWLFLRDIDADYEAMVTARRRFFAQVGLTPNTHYIASTGIEAAAADSGARVVLDAYAISGLQPGQVCHLRVPQQLGPTDMYGVTFERGTSIDYRDRRHLLISGTASIDDEGRILHVGDLNGQLERTLENIDVLLQAGSAGRGDVCQLIAYVREPRDGPEVQRRIRERFGPTPLVVVRGAVCRPAWLVEIEAQAIVPFEAIHLPHF